MNKQFNETELENAIIKLFKKNGYLYSNGETIHRKYTDILLRDDLLSFIKNRFKDLSDKEYEKIIAHIENITSSPLFIGNKETHKIITEGFNLIHDNKNQLTTHINYIDFEHPENNIFRIVNQYTVEDVEIRRPDLLIFINGIPLIIFEFKSAIAEEATIFDAWKQINIRYARGIPNLMKYCLMSSISDGANSKIGTIFSPYKYYYAWSKIKDTDNISVGISSLITMIKGAFSKDRLISIIRDFIFYPNNPEKEEVIICRYPQYFAANKMLINLKNHIKPKGDGKGGIYFGATGSGKTYTMLYLSRLLMTHERDIFNNPTIVIITDRDDLENQTTKVFASAKEMLKEKSVRSIETRADLYKTLKAQESGGIYITTIQKFCEDTGLLSNRSNIICISDEAHRSQTNIGGKLKTTSSGVVEKFGFAEYLRRSFPNATYCGFTGTPTDDAINVFGPVVDSYTMRESTADGITVRISYEPRMAKVILSDEDLKKIKEYYNKCEAQGANPAQIEESKKAMSTMSAILGHPDRIKKIAKDIAEHYTNLCAQKPEIVQKAMIVCNDRKTAFKLYKEIVSIKPDWSTPKKADNIDKYSKGERDLLIKIPKINLVATRDKNDPKELYSICGDQEYRKFLDEQFKNEKSNFKIAIVVDMWITGFDVPSLSVMYIDKPLQKHTLIQTISRVNRVFDGKEKGLIVDYIGIKQEMLAAIKQFGDKKESPVDELPVTISIFRNQLKLLDDLLCNFDSTKFFKGGSLDRLMCLNKAVEFVQSTKYSQNKFMSISRTLKNAYSICMPSGQLKKNEISRAQFYMAIRSIIYKQTVGQAPDAEIMNEVVEKMVQQAIICTGIEDVIDSNKELRLFDEKFNKQLDSIKLPITKFNALLKALRIAINSYGKVNKIKAIDFEQKLRHVVDIYNTRDRILTTNKVIADFVNDLSDELVNIMKELEEDKKSFKKLGITFEEKAFYDILAKIRDEHKFTYPQEKCLSLAKKIKKLVDDKFQYADWINRSDIKSELEMELTVLLYNNGFPPEWNDDVFKNILQQTENYKKNSK